MLERIGVFTTIVFVFFIYTSKAQNFNDTIYFDARDQWSVKYYYITDTVTGDEYIVNKVKYYPQIRQQLQFDSANCVLKIEVYRKLFKKKITVYIKPSSMNGKYLYLRVVRNKIHFSFRRKRFGKI